MTVDLAKLRSLDAAATKGPWEQHGIADAHCTIRCSGGDIFEDVWLDDAALIVALRNAAPGMLDELEEFRSYQPYTAALEECAQMRDELESLRKWCKASIDADQVLCAENERLRNEPLRLQADALMRALAATQKELAELVALQEETRSLNVRQCDELERLRRFRDAVMAERDAALKVDGADAETEEAHDLLCDALDEVIDEERAALAKENDNV